VNQLAARVHAAVAAGQKEAAAAMYMTFWIGRFKWWLMPAKARRKIVETVGKVAAEFAMLRGMTRAPRDYAGIGASIRLIYGQKTRPAAKAVVEVLAAQWPQAEVKTIAGAGHMSPMTHPESVAELVVEHVARPEAAAFGVAVPRP
jgi:pimeloyl-ACP methyl ester carboxylesterase